jgi:hypothetical protein
MRRGRKGYEIGQVCRKWVLRDPPTRAGRLCPADLRGGGGSCRRYFSGEPWGRPAFNLKPADVALLEDGNPRPFSIFEVPARRPVIELMVLFDLCDSAREALREGEGLYQIASDWDLGIAGAKHTNRPLTRTRYWRVRAAARKPN